MLLVPLRPAYEYAFVVLYGALSIETTVVEPGCLTCLGAGRDDIALSTGAETRALLLGGAPFPEPILMWWNFVARTSDEIDAAQTIAVSVGHCSRLSSTTRHRGVRARRF